MAASVDTFRSFSLATSTFSSTFPSTSADPVDKPIFAYPLPVSVTILLLSLVLSLATVTGNVFVMFSFYLERQLRTEGNYFIFSLALTDFLIGLFSMNLYSVYLVLGYWPLGEILCDFWLSLDFTACLTSQYTVFFITLDRFCSVRVPAKYRAWRTPNKVGVMIALTWIVPAIIFFPIIMAWNYIAVPDVIVSLQNSSLVTGQNSSNIQPVHPPHSLECFAEFTTYPVFNTILTLGYYWVTLVVMSGLYYGIYKVAKELQRKSMEKHQRMTLLMARAGQTMSRIGVGVGLTCPSGPGPMLGRYVQNSLELEQDGVTGNGTEVTPVSAPPDVFQGSPSYLQCRLEPEIATSSLSVVSELVSTLAASGKCINATPEKITKLRYIDDDCPPPGNPEDADRPGWVQEASSSGGVVEPSTPGSVSLSPHSPLTFILPSPRRTPSTMTAPIGKKSPHCTPTRTLSSASRSGGGSMAASSLRRYHHRQSQGRGHLKPSISSTQLLLQRPLLAMSKKLNNRRFALGKEGLGLTSAGVANASISNPAISMALQQRRGEHRANKALRTISIILGCFMLCWTPYHVLVLIKGFCDDHGKGTSCVHNHLYSASYWLCYLNSPINPFCYALVNRLFKRTFHRIFTCDLRRL